MSQLYRMTPLVTGIRQLSITPVSMKAVTEMPKRPATPWASFYAAQVPQYKKSYPNLAVPELMKKISEAWGQVSASEKEKMKQAYEKEKEIYNQKLKLVSKLFYCSVEVQRLNYRYLMTFSQAPSQPKLARRPSLFPMTSTNSWQKTTNQRGTSAPT